MFSRIFKRTNLRSLLSNRKKYDNKPKVYKQLRKRINRSYQYGQRKYYSNMINTVDLSLDPSNVKRGSQRQKLNISVNDRYHGYIVKGKRYVEERNLTVYELEHVKTGAKHLHIECDDLDNVFYIAFKTIPSDNKGTAHILEHLTLCGSEKYPVRDPFFNMMKRSLNTYMNAWTGPDITAYPFSTQNIKDYYNLMSVYLDAVFFSNLNYYDFLQEGYRLEFNEETEDLEHQGIVYNEMKGAMSEPNDIYIRELYRHLYPTTTYHFNSGGDPAHIREITIDDVKKFKERFYHPSNSYTITYGDMPLLSHLEFINSYFERFEKVDQKYEINDEIRFTNNKRVVIKGPLSTLSDPERQVKVSVNWLVDKGNDFYERFSMSILSLLLNTGASSPMYQALISSNIGNSYTPGTGYDSSPKEALFSVGLADIHEKDIDLVENIILETINRAAEEGFPEERVESILHQIEYGLKNVTTGFGLQLVSTLPSIWIHGNDPLDSFAVNEMIERLRADIARGNFFQNLIKKWLIDNKHRLTFIMIPDKDYIESEFENEERSLRRITEDENFINIKKKIIEDSYNLMLRQEQVDDVDILPKISIAEIERKPEYVDTIIDEINDTKIYWNNQPTNDIIYFNSLFDISDIAEDLLPYVPLFTSALVKMSTKRRNYQDLDLIMELKTGSFRAFQSIEISNFDINAYNLYLGLNSSCLSRNVDSMFDLWEEIINEVTFEDINRLKTIIGDITNTLQSSIIESGQKLASILSSENLLPHFKIREMWEGLYQFRFMRDLNEQEDLYDVVDKLNRLADILLSKERMKIAINAEQKNFNIVSRRIKSLTNSIKSNGYPTGGISIRSVSNGHPKVYVGLDSHVNFVAQSLKSVHYTHEDFSKVDVMAQILSTNYLHKEIREKGGAYGAGLSHSNGSLSFYSYRDPYVEETIDVYNKSVDWIKNGEFTENDVEEAKIQLFSYLDMPLPPSGKGLDEFTSGLTYEMKQERRERLFNVTKDDVVEVCNKYLNNDDKFIAVLGSNQNDQFKENKEWQYKEY